MNYVALTKVTIYNFSMKKSTFILGIFLLLFIFIEAQYDLERMNTNQYTQLGSYEWNQSSSGLKTTDWTANW